MPAAVQSQVASFKRSFNESITFLRRCPWTSLASNMLQILQSNHIEAYLLHKSVYVMEQIYYLQSIGKSRVFYYIALTQTIFLGKVSDNLNDHGHRLKEVAKLELLVVQPFTGLSSFLYQLT